MDSILAYIQRAIRGNDGYQGYKQFGCNLVSERNLEATHDLPGRAGYPGMLPNQGSSIQDHDHRNRILQLGHWVLGSKIQVRHPVSSVKDPGPRVWDRRIQDAVSLDPDRIPDPGGIQDHGSWIIPDQSPQGHAYWILD